MSRTSSLTLVDLDLDSALEVSSGGEDLGLLGGDSGVTVDQTGEDTTEGLDTERQRRDVEEENVGLLTAENTCLNRGSESDDFVRIYRLVRVLAEVLFNHLLDLRNTCRTTDEDDLFDVLRG